MLKVAVLDRHSGKEKASLRWIIGAKRAGFKRKKVKQICVSPRKCILG